MTRLSHHDLHAALECRHTAYATLDTDAFPRRILAELLRVVPAPFGSYNEIDPGAARIAYIVEPAEAMVPRLDLDVRQYLREQPVVDHYQRTGDGSPRKLSDFVSRSQLHRLGIYNENYRRSGVEYQMAFMFRSPRRPSPVSIAVALDRPRRGPDFSERERAVLAFLRPHIVAAYDNAETATALRRPAAPGGSAPDSVSRETISLRRGGRHLVPPRARGWLAQYFGEAGCSGDRLPDTLQRWVRQQALRLGRSDVLASPPAPLVVEQEETRLRVRFIPDPQGDLLVLEEGRRAAVQLPSKPGRLTPREAEILRWLRESKTDAEIGIILGTSPRTVSKHLQRIYAKLDVSSRTGAAMSSQAHREA